MTKKQEKIKELYLKSKNELNGLSIGTMTRKQYFAKAHKLEKNFIKMQDKAIKVGILERIANSWKAKELF